MSVFEKYLDKKKAALPTPEDPGRSLKEILSNSAESQVFGQYLEEEGDHDLAEKLAQGNLDADDLESLAERRKGFIELMDRSERLLETLDGTMIEELARLSPDLANIVSIAGAEGIERALGRFLPHLVITDRAHFETIERYVTNIKTTREDGAAQDKAITELCREYQITEEQFMELVEGGGDPAAIIHKIHGGPGFLGRRRAKLAELQHDLESHVFANAAALEGLSDRIDNNMSDIARSLRTTLRDFPQLHDAMVMNLRNEKIEKAPQSTAFSELKDKAGKLASEAPEEEAVVGEWHTWLAANRADLDAHHVSPVDAHRMFADSYVQSHTKMKGGFWQAIYQSLYSSLFADSVFDIVERRA